MPMYSHRPSPAWACALCLACSTPGSSGSASGASPGQDTGTGTSDADSSTGGSEGESTSSSEAESGEDRVLDVVDPTGACIAAGALVDTPLGPRNIEHLELGDEVYAYDPHTGERVVTPVYFVRSATRPCIRLHLDSGVELTLTRDHPVYSPDHDSYAHAGHWFSGELVEVLTATAEGPRRARLLRAEVVDAHEVFDIGVEHELHNFLANSVVVHNKDTGAGPCAEPCDPQMEDPCVSGELCLPTDCDDDFVAEEWSCEWSFGDGEALTPCTENQDCLEGSYCFLMGEDFGTGACVPLCQDGACEADSHCVTLGELEAPSCLPSCDPLAPECGEFAGPCVPDAPDGGFVCRPAPLFPGESFDTCELPEHCSPGLACADDAGACGSSATCCLPYCDLNAPNSCTDGLACLPLWGNDTPVVGYEHVGVCGTP